MRGLVVVVCLTGCFVQVGASYTPSTSIGVQRASDPMALMHTEATTSFNFRIGVHFDIAGVGAHYAWYAARAIRSAGGLPATINGHGTSLRFDVDLPIAFGPDNLFRLRGSYAYDKFDQMNVANVDAQSSVLTAHGTGHHAGITVATLNKDLAFSFLAGKFSFASTDGMASGWPNFAVSGWDLDVGVTVNFIPTGNLISHFVAGPYDAQKLCGMWTTRTNSVAQFGCN